MATPTLTAPLSAVTDLGGRALAGLTRGLAAVRAADKPLHPDGTTFAATLTRHGATAPIGVSWLDAPGEDQVLVRLSRAIGLPGPVPDIAGLALRLRRGQTRYADLLLASTGWNPLTRHLLTPAWREHQPLTTLLPYRGPSGPIVIGARADDDARLALNWAPVGGRWRHVADLTLDEALPQDAEVSFDPVLNPLPGLEQYGWVQHLRERSYATAHRSRR